MSYFTNYNTFKAGISLVFERNNPHDYFGLAGNQLRTSHTSRITYRARGTTLSYDITLRYATPFVATNNMSASIN